MTPDPRRPPAPPHYAELVRREDELRQLSERRQAAEASKAAAEEGELRGVVLVFELFDHRGRVGYCSDAEAVVRGHRCCIVASMASGLARPIMCVVLLLRVCGAFASRGGVFVNNALARGPIDDRYSCLQRSFGRGFVGGRPDSLDGGAHLRTDGAVALVGLGVGAQSFFC